MEKINLIDEKMKEEVRICKKYRKLKEKLQKNILDLNFFLRCKRLKIIPKFLRINTCRNNRNFQILQKAEEQLLNKEIFFKRRIIQSIEIKIYNKHLIYSDIITPIIWEMEYKKTTCNLEKEFNRISMIHDKKIEFWQNKGRRYRWYNNNCTQQKQFQTQQNQIENSSFGNSNQINDDQKYINWSSKKLTKEEDKVLNLGPKFVFGSLPKPETVIFETEELAKNIKSEYREKLKKDIIRSFKESKKNEHTDKNLKILKQLKNDPNLAFVKADKSPKIVILNKDQYITKVEEILRDLKAIQVENPTEKIIKELSNLKKRKYLPKELVAACHHPAYPTVPHMFMQIKIHKPNAPLRPLVAKYKSPLYNLEKALAKFLNPLVISNQNTVKNTSQIIDELEKIKEEISQSSEMVSLDVKSLFPSVNPHFAKKLILNKLEKVHNFNHKELTTLEKALNLIIENNIFTINQKIYKQTSGCPMGSPMSPTFAEVVMQEVEEKAFKKTNFNPILYKRYVDDCLLIFNSQENFQEFFDIVNNINYSIKFTVEKSQNKSIPFLDLLIQIKEKGVEYQVYRKPTAGISPILPSSAHPLQYKLAVFRAHIRRAFVNSSDVKKRDEELKKIKETMLKAGYSHNMFCKIVSTVKKSIYPISRLTKEKENKNIQYISIAYHPNTAKIYNIFKKYSDNEIRLAYRPSTNIQNILCSKSKIAPNSGIYFVPIQDHNDYDIKVYIGQTSRMLQTRLKEHKESISIVKQQTALSLYIRNNDASPLWEEAGILATPRIQEINVAETLFIIANKNNCINKNLPLEINQDWKQILETDNSKITEIKKYVYSKIFSGSIQTDCPKSWLNFCKKKKDGTSEDKKIEFVHNEMATTSRPEPAKVNAHENSAPNLLKMKREDASKLI